MTGNQHENELTGPEELAVEIAAIQPRLYGFILKRLADREQTLEVLQRTNLVICRKAGEFQHGSSFAAWAFTIAKFQAMAWRKSEGAGRLVFTDKVYELLDRTAEQEVTAVDERIPWLRRCLQRLRDVDEFFGFLGGGHQYYPYINMKAYRKNFGKWQVFDVTTDVSESADVAGQNAEFLSSRIADGAEWAKTHMEPQWHDTEAGLKSWIKNKMPKYDLTFKAR